MRPVLLLAALALTIHPTFHRPVVFDPDSGPEGVPRMRPRPKIDPTIAPEALAAARFEILRTARAEAQRIERAPRAAVAGMSWVNLGPTDGLVQYAGLTLSHVGSGRLNAIRVDPRDPDIVYLASAGGGVWKTWNFSAPDAEWHPITELLGTLQIGAMDLDPQHPDTIFLGLGDFYDGLAGVVMRSRDGGRTWDDPIALGRSLSVRDLRVDPADSSSVLVTTDIGLYRSADGGDHFAAVDLPNAGGITLAEATWSLAYAGAGHWLVTGVQACDRGLRPPRAAYGLPADAYCRLGNLGDIWRSADGGATWTSARAAAALPIPAGDLGRMTLGVGATTDPEHTAVYAWAETVDEGAAGGTNQLGDILRSTDGGATFTSARGALSNPIAISGSTYDCRDMNLGHNQSWYNQAVAVDPTNDAHVIIGGQVCGMRTTSGTAPSPRWDNVSYQGDLDVVRCGALSWVHPDWHAAAVVPLPDGGVRVYVGTDGGVFTADNVFSAAAGHECDIQWQDHNHGIVSHQLYALASGDPSLGNPDLVYGSLQDNGTLYRNRDRPTEFDMMSFGDGVGSVATPEIFWLSTFGLGTEAHRYDCRPAQSDCSKFEGWTLSDPTEPSGDATGFIARFAAAQAEPGGVVLSYSNHNVWRSEAANATWQSIGSFGATIENVAASQTIPHLYGAVFGNGHAAVSSDGTSWTMSGAQLGVGAAISQRMRGATSIAFPPSGGNPGDVYVVSSNAPTLDDGRPVPDSIGRLFITRNRGSSFAPLSGSGLPNVPIEVVRYDPGDAMTLYAGTEIGVYRSADGGATWARFGEGLPMVRVTDIYVARNSSLLRASTFGRGLWEIYPTATPRGVPGDGDFDRNGELDFVDLAALTARLGTTPATTQAPFYSWYCDLTGDANAIDEDDLMRLLARLGGHP